MISRRLYALIPVAISSFALTSCGMWSGEARDDSERAEALAKAGIAPLKAGRWETTYSFTEIDVPTLGNGKKRQIMQEMSDGTSGASCLSDVDASSPSADFFGGKGSDKCAYTRFKANKGGLDMALTCNMEGMGSIDMNMKGPASNSSYDLDTAVAVRLPIIGKVKMHGKATSRYVGPCTGKE